MLSFIAKGSALYMHARKGTTSHHQGARQLIYSLCSIHCIYLARSPRANHDYGSTHSRDDSAPECGHHVGVAAACRRCVGVHLQYLHSNELCKHAAAVHAVARSLIFDYTHIGLPRATCGSRRWRRGSHGEPSPRWFSPILMTCILVSYAARARTFGRSPRWRGVHDPTGAGLTILKKVHA